MYTIYIRVKKMDFMHEVAPRSMFYGHNYIEEPEPLRCFGSGMASSASRYYRKGNFCDQFVTKFNDTVCMYNREPKQAASNTFDSNLRHTPEL